MEHTFTTASAPTVHVELGAGSLRIIAAATDTTQVAVTGPDADRVEVQQLRDHISIVAPRQRLGFLGEEHEAHVEVTAPSGARLVAKLGSADTSAEGELTEVALRAASGDVDLATVLGNCQIGVGSGDITLHSAGTASLKSASGSVRIGTITGSLAVSTGSGEVSVEQLGKEAVVKTGSGSLAVERGDGSLIYATGSGDLRIGAVPRGKVVANTASGDARIGVPPGTPVWADLNSLTGAVRSDLASAGRPGPGQEHVELRVTSVSGDIDLVPA